MKKLYTIVSLLVLSMMLVSCGGKQAAFSHIIVKSDRLGVLLDTKDAETLASLQDIFYDKEEQPDGGPEFRFLIDITTSEGTVRWQYSLDGYIRNYEEAASMIYLLKDVAAFNRAAKIR